MLTAGEPHVNGPLILDRYRPLEELASGGFADVVLAYDTRMQRRVAIKRLPLPLDAAGRVRPSAGLAEARTAALLNHPDIVIVHEWDTDSDEAFLIMEYVEGPSLADVLDAGGALNLDAAAAVVDALASALDFAHENGVLHLDIKPENVLITRDGRPKITDFGVSTLSSAGGHGPTHGGTIGYMPLEQLRGEQVDERTDIWAFAALTYELLTDANPFAADTVEGAIFKAEITDTPAPSEFEPTLDPAIDDVLLAALALYREDRYPSIAAFASRLLPLLGDAEIGRELLAGFAERYAREHGNDEDEYDRPGLWDRLAPLSGLASRLVSAVTASWLAWTGIVVFDPGTAASAGATALVALASLLAPPLGVLLGLTVFSAGLAASGLVGPAALFALVSATVWWFAGREGAGLGGSLGVVALGLVRIGLSGPLLLGYRITPLRAAILSAYSGGLLMLASAASGGRAPFVEIGWRILVEPLGTRVAAGGVAGLLSTPAPLAALAAWAAAAALASAIGSRATRLAGLGGGVLGLVVLYGGYTMAGLIAAAFGSTQAWSGSPLLVALAAAGLILIALVAAGPPYRAEED